MQTLARQKQMTTLTFSLRQSKMQVRKTKHKSRRIDPKKNIPYKLSGLKEKPPEYISVMLYFFLKS